MDQDFEPTNMDSEDSESDFEPISRSKKSKMLTRSRRSEPIMPSRSTQSRPSRRSEPISKATQTEMETGQPIVKRKPVQRRSTESNYHCTYCKSGFKTKQIVYDHLNRERACKDAHKLHKYKAVWEEELKNKANPLPCDIPGCKRRFPNAQCLRNHKKRQGIH